MTGTVVRMTPSDSGPVPGTIVVLHRVDVGGGAAIDSTATDTRGRYAFARDRPDSEATYLVSVSYDGIAYFSRPIDASTGAADTIDVAVFDTSSSTPTVDLDQRHIIVRDVGENGGRRLIELIVLSNGGRLTRISPDSSRPTWQGVLPREAAQLEVGESDVSPAAVYRRGDSLAIAAPIPPGPKQLVVSYIVPATTTNLVIPFDQPAAHVTLLIEDTTASVTGAPLEFRGLEEIEDAYFRHFSGSDIAAATSVTIRFARSGRPWSPQSLWWVIVPLAGAAMALALWWWLRTASVPSPAAHSPDGLAARIAALDSAFEARGDAVTEVERATYRRERDELKRQLSDELAARRSTR